MVDNPSALVIFGNFTATGGVDMASVFWLERNVLLRPEMFLPVPLAFVTFCCS